MAELIIDDGTANKNKLKICSKEKQTWLDRCSELSLKLRFQSLKYVLTYSFKELWETLVDNCFHNLAIDVSKPNRHHGSNDKQSGEEVDIARLLARPVRQHNLGQL